MQRQPAAAFSPAGASFCAAILNPSSIPPAWGGGPISWICPGGLHPRLFSHPLPAWMANPVRLSAAAAAAGSGAATFRYLERLPQPSWIGLHGFAAAGFALLRSSMGPWCSVRWWVSFVDHPPCSLDDLQVIQGSAMVTPDPPAGPRLPHRGALGTAGSLAASC